MVISGPRAIAPRALTRLLPLAFNHFRSLVLIRLPPLAVVTARLCCALVTSPDAYAPSFGRVPYAPTSHASVVAVASHERRMFGAPVDDEPPT